MPHLSEKAVQQLFGIHGAAQIDSIPQLNVRVLRVPAAKRDLVVAALNHNPNIEFAEKNSIASLGATNSRSLGSLSVRQVQRLRACW